MMTLMNYDRVELFGVASKKKAVPQNPDIVAQRRARPEKKSAVIAVTPQEIQAFIAENGLDDSIESQILASEEILNAKRG